jgi:hypothetical protein
MIPTKYPKRPEGSSDRTHSEDYADDLNGDVRKVFDKGSAYKHAQYMVEMSFRHPIMYVLWYMWAIPLLLDEDEKPFLHKWIKYHRTRAFRPYWAEFALYHPVLFCLYWIGGIFFQFLIKLLTTPKQNQHERTTHERKENLHS